MTDHEPSIVAEDETHYCEVHPDRETELRCNKCGRYMCVQCAVHTQVGYRCKQCVREQDDKFYTGTSIDYVLLFGVALGVGAAGGVIALFIGFWILSMFIGLGAGGVIGTIGRRVTHKRFGRHSGQIATVGGVVGAILAPIAYIFLRAGVLIVDPQVIFSTVNIGLLVYIGALAFATYAAFNRGI